MLIYPPSGTATPGYADSINANVDNGGRSRQRPRASNAAPTSGIGQRRLRRRVESGSPNGQRKSDKRWEEILAGAARVFHRIGYGQATLEDVAAEVGITRASLYYYVSDKRELLMAILDAPIVAMTERIWEIQALDISAKEKLKRAVLEHMKALKDNYPDLFVFLAENLHTFTIDVGLNARRYADAMQAIIEEGVSAGQFRDDVDPEVAMRAIVGMCNWTHRWFSPKGRYSLTEIGEQFATLAVSGLTGRRR